MSDEGKTVLLDLDILELQEYLRSIGEPAFRARQLYQWIYTALVFDFEQMNNLPMALRRRLQQLAEVLPLRPLVRREADDGMTVKTLFELGDGRTIESVLMLYEARQNSRARRTVCVSSQVGCAIGCPFCATGVTGLERNLSPGEIVGQVLHYARLLSTGEVGRGRVTNVVFMGQGEPLANFDHVWKAVEILNSPYGLNLGARHITISTAGLAPQMVELARRSTQVGLAVSLHAPNDRLRDVLVPVNKAFPISRLLGACREYIRLTNRRVTFEYALIGGVNDSLAQARELAKLLAGLLCHVNLIPLNPTTAEFKRTQRKQVLAFRAELSRLGIATTVRAERGGHIEAACGQLKSACRT
ncbi:MAG: 23S rRNA (adenine(2503)-C(2))-methyltransferase RlmN [Chloroflexota bacterium]